MSHDVPRMSHFQDLRKLMACESDIANLERAHALTTTNRSQGIAALVELANKGSVMSMLYLAEAYYLGPNVDVPAAEFWFQSAQKHDCSKATYGLGVINYWSGRFDRAEEYFAEGASKNDPLCMYWLAHLRISGSEYDEQFLAAEKLLRKSSALGSLRAKIVLGKFYVFGKYGMRKIPKGLFLLSSGIIQSFCVAWRDPSSWRL